jgi:hypothetical protein
VSPGVVAQSGLEQACGSRGTVLAYLAHFAPASSAAREAAARKLARRPGRRCAMSRRRTALAEHERARRRARRLGEAGRAQARFGPSTERWGHQKTESALAALSRLVDACLEVAESMARRTIP